MGRRFTDSSQIADWFSVPSDDKRPAVLNQPKDTTPPAPRLSKANHLFRVTALPKEPA